MPPEGRWLSSIPRREVHLAVEEFVDLEGKGRFVDGAVVDRDEFPTRGEEVGAGYPDPSVLGNGDPVGIEVMGEGEVELVEE